MAFNMILNPDIAIETVSALARAYAPPQAIEIYDKSRVCIVVIHQGMIHGETLRWIDWQTNQGAQIVFHYEQAKLCHESPILEKYLNCAAARDNARKIALKKACDWFMFLDADVVPPINALDHFLLQKTPVRGGWYPIKQTDRYVAGRWVADNVLCNYTQPKTTRLYQSDVLPAGCCMVDRVIAELIPFEHGIEWEYTDHATGQRAILGECGIYGNRLHELGERVWMNPAVVCRHLNFN